MHSRVILYIINIFFSILKDINNGSESDSDSDEKYLLDPALLLQEAKLPSVFMVTSEEDLIEKDTLKLDMLMTEKGIIHELLKFPKGINHKLVHVFSVMYPMYPESREVFNRMNTYFKDALCMHQEV